MTFIYDSKGVERMSYKEFKDRTVFRIQKDRQKHSFTIYLETTGVTLECFGSTKVSIILLALRVYLRH